MGDERQKQQQPYVLLSAILTALGLFNMLTLHTGPPVCSAKPKKARHSISQHRRLRGE